MDERIMQAQQAFGIPESEAIRLVAEADRIQTEVERQLAEVAKLRELFGLVHVGCFVRVPCDPSRLATVVEGGPNRWRVGWHDGQRQRFAWWDTNQLTMVACRGDVRQREDDVSDAHVEAMRP